MNDTETLKGLIEMAVERHQTSARQLAFKAQEAGLKITYTTLNQIRSNTYKSVPGEQTLRAIAWLAGVEDSVAFTAAGQPVPGPPLADELPPGADNLSPKSRKAVVEMVRVLVDLETGSNAQRTSDSNDAPPQLQVLAPASDPSSRQKIDALTPEEIKLVTMRENRRKRRENQDYMHGLSQHPDMSASMLMQGKSHKEVRDALIEAGKSAREEFHELGVAGRAVLKEHAASATPGSLPKKGARYEVINPKGSASGHSSPGSITELHGAEAAEYPAPPKEQLAAHPKVKTKRELLDEQTGERDNEDNEG